MVEKHQFLYLAINTDSQVIYISHGLYLPKMTWDIFHSVFPQATDPLQKIKM